MTWKPVLTDSLAAAAWTAIRDIADEISVRPSSRDCPEHVALFWAYATAELDDASYDCWYEAAAEEVIARISSHDRPLPLYGGLAGLGWVLSHLADDADECLSDVDATLIDMLALDPWRGPYDLIGGLVGHAVYFLARRTGSPKAARRGLELVVQRLEASRELGPRGATWRTAPDLLPEHQRTQCPRGHYNLGVAHGVPGVAAILGHIAADDALPGAATLYVQASAWLRSQLQAPDPRGRLPSWIADGNAPDRARTAWCYGDLGVAVAMWNAAAACGESVDGWCTLAGESARRDASLCRVGDAGLCHGAFGLAHLFNRCYQASGQRVFCDAARAWFERGLAMRTRGSAHDLLEGAAGIGLALLAGVGTKEPAWDRLLLADIPAG